MRVIALTLAVRRCGSLGRDTDRSGGRRHVPAVRNARGPDAAAGDVLVDRRPRQPGRAEPRQPRRRRDRLLRRPTACRWSTSSPWRPGRTPSSPPAARELLRYDVRRSRPLRQHRRLTRWPTPTRSCRTGGCSPTTASCKDSIELDARLDELGAADLVGGQTDSERVFALITAETRRHGGDVGAGLVAAVSWIAASCPSTRSTSCSARPPTCGRCAIPHARAVRARSPCRR